MTAVLNKCSATDCSPVPRNHKPERGVFSKIPNSYTKSVIALQSFFLSFLFQAIGTNFDSSSFCPACAGRQSCPLKVGVFSYFLCRVVFPAQKHSSRPHLSTFLADLAFLSHSKNI